MNKSSHAKQFLLPGCECYCNAAPIPFDVNQPEAAIEIFAGQQLRAAVGRRHPGWGTRNALSYFGLTYIEFLAISDLDELRAATDKFLLFARCRTAAAGERGAVFRVRCAATTSTPPMTTCVARG